MFKMSNFPHKIDFKTKQAEFSAYIRNPTSNTCPDDVAPERMKIYRELFYNNVENFIASNFPVLREVLNDLQWHRLTQDFFANHTCTTPYFSEIPEEFIIYLQNERITHEDDYPFMLELAHYEWVEMALTIAQENLADTKIVQITSDDQVIGLSPLAWPLVYQFPVHKISPDYLPTQTPEQASYLVVYRDSKDDVKFIELAPMSFRLLQTLQKQKTISVTNCLTNTLPENSAESFINSALEAIQQFIDKRVIFTL